MPATGLPCGSGLTPELRYHIGEHARVNPERPAVILDGRELSYRDLDERSARLAMALHTLGLGPGLDIRFLLENSFEFYEVAWAAQRSGLYYTAISTTLTADEVAFIMNDCGATVFISSPVMLSRENASRLPQLRHRIATGPGHPGYESYETLIDGTPRLPREMEAEGCDMLYSSGTTGRPKAVRPLPGDRCRARDGVTPAAPTAPTRTRCTCRPARCTTRRRWTRRHDHPARRHRRWSWSASTPRRRSPSSSATG